MFGLVVVLVVGAVAVAIGTGFGIVIAPRLGRLFDRAESNEDASLAEEPRDRAD